MKTSRKNSSLSNVTYDSSFPIGKAPSDITQHPPLTKQSRPGPTNKRRKETCLATYEQIDPNLSCHHESVDWATNAMEHFGVAQAEAQERSAKPHS